MAAPKKGIDLSLVIPIYNQEKFIKPTTRAYVNAFEKSPLVRSFEIILVSNNCTDNTPHVCARLAKKYAKIKHFDYPLKILKGGAVIRGFQHARFPFLGFTDVDMATAPEEFLKLISPLSDEKVGASIASRQMPDSVLFPPQPFIRRILGMLFAIVREGLFGLGINDSQCGAKIFRKELIEPMKLTHNGFTFDVELLYRVKKKGFVIREIGITWQDKPNSIVFAADPWLPISMLKELFFLRLRI